MVFRSGKVVFARIEVVVLIPMGLEVTMAKYGQVNTHLTQNFDMNAVVRSIFLFETLFLISCL